MQPSDRNIADSLYKMTYISCIQSIQTNIKACIFSQRIWHIFKWKLMQILYGSCRNLARDKWTYVRGRGWWHIHIRLLDSQMKMIAEILRCFTSAYISPLWLQTSKSVMAYITDFSFCRISGVDASGHTQQAITRFVSTSAIISWCLDFDGFLQ